MCYVTQKFYSCMHKGSFTYFLGNMYITTLLSVHKNITGKEDKNTHTHTRHTHTDKIYNQLRMDF